MIEIIIRIPRAVYERAVIDLQRPHDIAAERIGYFLANAGNTPDGRRYVLFSDYRPVPDDVYLPDDFVGARFGSKAIQMGMQWALDSGRGIFHAHMHLFPGRPHPSGTDAQELPRLVPGFQSVSPAAAHGIIILSTTSAAAWVWLPKSEHGVQVTDISIVGQPLAIMR